jgi:hypothetical protein
MQKFVIVVYDFFELCGDGSAKKIEKWERVPFCEENIEYSPDMSYEDNVKNFVEECIESNAVYIGEKYIPIYNIHGWYFDKEKEQPKKVEQQNSNTRQPTHPNQDRKFRRYKKMKHYHNKPRPAAATLPYQVEKSDAPSIKECGPDGPIPPEPRLIKESESEPSNNDYNAEP